MKTKHAIKDAAKPPHARPDVQEPTCEPRPGDSGSRGKVVDAEFHEAKPC